MQTNETAMAKFLVDNVEPWEDTIFGNYYRASAYLTDGTFLPCVKFGNPERLINQAMKRFEETRNDEFQYRQIVETFVAGKSFIPIYFVSKVDVSPYAWPLELLKQIHGETTMGWTSFTAKMTDGNIFAFGTGFNFEFFDLPKGYAHTDIAEIHSGMIVDADGTERPFTHEWDGMCYRDKPFFNCYSWCLPNR